MNTKDLSEKYPAKGKEVVHKEIESKSVLLNLENGSYYTLNKTGTFIWSLLDGKIAVNQLVELLTESFDVTKDEASKDVFALIANFKKEGLVELNDKSE
ncbi:MAG TPA: PqqD family protein [Thermodesulfobacteriota bacterium]|nr:PqqD family protein [Thermodesulfobacteriota bacterium]